MEITGSLESQPLLGVILFWEGVVRDLPGFVIFVDQVLNDRSRLYRQLVPIP